MKRILVTGAAGFIGSDFVDLTLEAYPDSYVIGLDALTYAGGEDNLIGAKATGRMEFVHGDVCDLSMVKELVRQVDGVVHFAAETMVDRSVLDPEPFLRTNVLGTGCVMEAVRRHPVERVLHISTPEVYGQRLGSAAGEKEALDPRNVYAASKAAAEMVCRAYTHSFNAPVIFTRGAVALGPRQYPEKVTALWITNALEGKELPLYGDGSAVRDFVHVRDLNRANDLAFRHGAVGEAYNVAAFELSLRELGMAIIERTGVSPELLQSTPQDRPAHDYRYHMDGSKLGELGWRPLMSFEEAVDDAVRWYSANREWWGRRKGSDDFRRYLERNVSYSGLPFLAPRRPDRTDESTED